MRKGNTNTVIRVPCNIEQFFYLWVQFISPLKKMIEKEKVILAQLLYSRYMLAKSISDPILLKQVLLSTENRKIIGERCNMKLENIQVYISNLRKKQIIEDEDIAKKFIPKLEDPTADLTLKIFFDFKADEKIVSGSSKED